MKTFLTRTFILAFLLTISYAASAQVYLGGSIGGGYAESPSTSSKSWAVNISPEVGYAFNENWAVGGRIGYGKSVSEIDSPYLEEIDTEINLFTINPYVAYSHVRFKGFAVWAEAGLQFAPKQEGAGYSTFAGYITPVLTYDLGKRITLKTNLNFAGLMITGTTDGGFAFAGSFGGDDAISLDDDLSIGFVFRF